VRNNSSEPKGQSKNTTNILNLHNKNLLTFALAKFPENLLRTSQKERPGNPGLSFSTQGSSDVSRTPFNTSAIFSEILMLLLV
jgi:hypothetical protein